MRSRHFLVLIGALTGFAKSPLGAQASGSQCDAFQRAIDDGEKSIAEMHASRTKAILSGGSSASLEMSYKLDEANELQLIAINVQLMIQAKCQTQRHPVDYGVFISAATACSNAGYNSTECNKSTWKKRGIVEDSVVAKPAVEASKVKKP